MIMQHKMQHEMQHEIVSVYYAKRSVIYFFKNYLKDLCTEAAVHLKIKPQSVAKAVSRAVVDIWDYGDRMLLSTLYGHDISVKPSPKDLILILHQHTK